MRAPFHSFPIAALLALFMAAPALAQSKKDAERNPGAFARPRSYTGDVAEPGPAAGRAPSPAPATPAARDCARGCLTAETQGGGEGHYWARGNVAFEIGEVSVLSDRFDLYETAGESGRRTRRVVAEGNVVFQRGDERLAGDRLDMDLAGDRAVLENAYGFLEPDVFVEAERIERVDSSTYRIQGGRFTSCAQPNPRWGFTASKATIKRDERIVAKNVVFRVKAFPTLYLPIFYYPIRDDQRSTGLLFPRFGYSSFRGVNVGTGFFWAMGRSYDQTFSVDYYSKFGTGYGHEFRYQGLGSSAGSLQTTLFQRSDIEAWDYDVTWRAAQDLPKRFRATLNARLFSSTSFQQRVQDDLNRASARNQRANLAIQGKVLGQTLQFAADHNETFFGETNSQVSQRLPTLRLSRPARRIGATGIVFGYSVWAERLARGNQDTRAPYNRFNIAPSLSRPWATTFLQVEPRIDFRYTRYGKTIDEEEGTLSGAPLARPVFEGNVEMRGPTFAKVFSLGGFYSPRFKHEIGPEFTWTYRTAVDEFEAIPKFDGTDQLLGTNQLRYSLVQRLLAKRPNRQGKLVTHDVLSWRISQTYFANIAEGQNEFDPNLSTSFFGPGGIPSNYSPIQSRMRLNPTSRIRATFDVEYDINFRQLRSLGLGLTGNFERGRLQAGWSKAERLAVEPEDRTVFRNTVRAAGNYEFWPDHIDFWAAADYDLKRKSLIRSSGRLRLGVQCCALMLEMINFNYNSRSERQFRFALELANIGSFGFGGEGQGLSVSR